MEHQTRSYSSDSRDEVESGVHVRRQQWNWLVGMDLVNENGSRLSVLKDEPWVITFRGHTDCLDKDWPITRGLLLESAIPKPTLASTVWRTLVVETTLSALALASLVISAYSHRLVLHSDVVCKNVTVGEKNAVNKEEKLYRYNIGDTSSVSVKFWSLPLNQFERL